MEFMRKKEELERDPDVVVLRGRLVRKEDLKPAPSQEPSE